MAGRSDSRGATVGLSRRPPGSPSSPWGPPHRSGGMMATGYEFGEPMEGASGIRTVRWRLLLAHDAGSAACDALARVVESALGPLDLTDASSIDDARVALYSVDFHVALVCLDLPPAPIGGARLAQEVL